MAAPSTPEREAHHRVVRVLESLEGKPFTEAAVVFAGGTRLALAYDEYRLSKDIDFLTSDQRGYADLRSAVRDRGVAYLFKRGAEAIKLPRPARIDQYGIRFPAVVDGHSIKFEIVAEGRILLGKGVAGRFTDIPWASVEDSFAEKLLANSDRWADDAYLSRDLIDLAALRTHEGPVPSRAWKRVIAAYGSAAPRDLERAAARFLQRDDYRARCFERLDVRGAERLLGAVVLLKDEAREVSS